MGNTYSVSAPEAAGDVNPMMAVGLAARIMTFILFSWSMIGTYEARCSAGITAGDNLNTRIDIVIGDLEAATDCLQYHKLGNSELEKALQQLASKCSGISSRLLNILRDMQAGGKISTLRSLKEKLESLRYEKDISAIEEKLSKYRARSLGLVSLMLKLAFPSELNSVC